MATYTPNMSVVVSGSHFPGQGDGSTPPMSYADNMAQGMIFHSQHRPQMSVASGGPLGGGGTAYSVNGVASQSNNLPGGASIPLSSIPHSAGYELPAAYYSRAQQHQPGVEHPNSHMSGSPRTVMMPQPYHHPPYNGPGYPYNTQRLPYTPPKSSVVHHGPQPMDKNSSLPEGYMPHPSQYPPMSVEHQGYYPGNVHPSEKMRYAHQPPGPHQPPSSMNGPMPGPRTKSQVAPSMPPPPPSASPLNHNMRSPHTVSPMLSSPNNMHRSQPPSSPRVAMPPTAVALQQRSQMTSPGGVPPHVATQQHVMNSNAIVRNPQPTQSLDNGITPNITANNAALSEEDIKNSASSSGHLPYSKQYELGDEPQRKKFLDTFKDFMEQNGTPVLRVPMADNTNNIPLDLYKLYREVCRRNGMPEVNKNKTWNEVAKALQIKDDKSAVSFLRKQYIKYLFAFECKFDHSLDFLTDHGPEPLRLNHDMRRGPDMDKQPAPKRQATANGPTVVPSSERFVPPNSYYNNYYPPGSHPGPHPGPHPGLHAGPHGPGPHAGPHGPGGPHSGPHPGPHPGAHPPDMHNGGPPPNMTPGFIPPQGPPDHPGYRPMYYGQYPPGHPGHHPGPHIGYMRPPYPPDHMAPHGPDSWRYRAPYPGTPPPGPTFYGEQQIQRYPANSVQPPYTPSPAPRLQVAPAPTKMSNLARKTDRSKSATEAKKKAAAAAAAASAALQASSQPLHISPMVTTTPNSISAAQMTSLRPGYNSPEVAHNEPPRIEQARPNINKRRKLTSKELGYVETIRLVMSLKSGLLTESTWVLNVLNVLLCDNTMVAYFYLGHHPNLLRMLDRLLDHFQKVLVEIFGETLIGNKLYSDAKLVGLQPSTKKYKDVAPVSCAVETSDKSTEPYPSVRPNGLQALSYIDTVHEINSQLKLTPSYPVDLAEIDSRFGEPRLLKTCKDNNKENATPTVEKMDVLPNLPSTEVKDELSKIKEGVQQNGTTETPTKPIDYGNISEESLRTLWKKLRGSNEKRVENESIKLEDQFLFIQSDQDRHLSSRCGSIMNIFRSLSFIPGNDMILSHHPGFLLMISQLLCLHHIHYKQPDSLESCPTTFERSSKRSIKDKETLGLPEHWCFATTLNTLREAAFCIMANISGQLDFSNFNQSLYGPLVQSVVHWVTCPSSEAVDPFPPAYLSSITPQRLMLEALSKMSILTSNLSPIVRSIKSQLLPLFKTLVLLLSDRQQQVAREFSLVIMSNLSQTLGNDGVVVAKNLASYPQVISLLLKFLEDAEASAANFALNAHMQGQSSLPPNISQEELCGGTSIDMLRRAALTLIHLAKYSNNKKLFLTHQHRVLNLAMSRFTHPRIGAMIANLLFHMETSSPFPS